MVNDKETQEKRKQAWLGELTNFIVKANKETYAVGKGQVEAERKGFKELEFEEGDWRLRDSYSGYFKAPGWTTVYYKGRPVWYMTYGGQGMAEGKENKAPETYGFLVKAVMLVSPEMPFRGPEKFSDGEWEYVFKPLKGDITGFGAVEEIRQSGDFVFSQDINGGLIVDKDENRQIVFPWNL